MRAFVVLFILVAVHGAMAGTIAEHKKEVTEITKKTLRFERRIQDLQTRKAHSREGAELEGVLTEIGDVHKDLLSLRRERNNLKEHLIAEHPDSNLLFDPHLHRSFDKRSSDKKGPLDHKLDSLLNLMQKQYGKYITAEKPSKNKKSTVVTSPTPPAADETPKVPLTKQELKEQYMRDKVESGMKIAAPTEEEMKKKAEEAKKAAEAAAAAPKEAPPSEGHH